MALRHNAATVLSACQLAALKRSRRVALSRALTIHRPFDKFHATCMQASSKDHFADQRAPQIVTAEHVNHDFPRIRPGHRKGRR
jgi:hypothetical protein